MPEIEEDLTDEIKELSLTVRVPRDTLYRIDAVVRARRNKIPRHSWLLEAIYEKLYKEELVEGTLDILWENNSNTAEIPIYRLLFLDMHRSGGPLAPVTLIGNESLEARLIQWGFKSENAKAWLQKLRTDRTVSIPNVMMPSEWVGPYGFKRKKIVRVWTIRCPNCEKEHVLLGLGFFSKDSSPARPVFEGIDSRPFSCDGACQGQAFNFGAEDLYLGDREIDEDEPNWATRYLLRMAADQQRTAELLRSHSSEAICLKLAEIYEETSRDWKRIAKDGSGKEKLDAIHGASSRTLSSVQKL